MGRVSALTVVVGERIGEMLDAIRKGTHSPGHLVQRASVVLMAAAQHSNTAIARKTGWSRNTIKEWRKRWVNKATELAEVEADRPWALRASVKAVLEDNRRSGRPSTYTSEQIACIIKIALDRPEEHDVPLSHWTPSALAREAVKDGIVESISSRQVGRYLSDADLKPHLSRYWLNPNIADPQEFREEVKAVCDIYNNAETLDSQGVRIHTSDEMTGIQALEHKAAALPMAPGKVERPEFEYVRHGTSGLIVSRNVVDGTVECPLIQPTRTEDDFARHVADVIDQASASRHIFVADQLNTHQSESLVLLVAERCEMKLDAATLGIKQVMPISA